ncbi:MAG: DUF3144 domain-containing protein [Gammaproteobacteria bacterium]|nr:DUF3144 domain-containing protein [Gammaproteobacteria bacterium]
MAKTDQELHTECVNRFIALANAMKDEGIAINIVSGGLMTASGLYATYAVGGDDGGLTESGVDKVALAYKKELARIQEIKKPAPRH